MEDSVQEVFGHRLRVRVCGILIENNRILLVKHKGLGSGEYLWIPPGGGMDYGMSATENLSREYREETGLTVKVGDLLFVHEFLQKPLHALELFFAVERMAGQALTGIDPEMANYYQVIEDVKYFSIEEVKQEKEVHMHQSLRTISSFQDILKKRGYFKYSK